MRVSELMDKLGHYVEIGIVDADADVEFLLEGDDWNRGSSIYGTLAVRDGEDNQKLFLTNFEKVIL